MHPLKTDHPTILIAPDSFKGSLSAAAVATAIGDALAPLLPQAHLILLPLADGGEGTAAVLQTACGGSWHSIGVRGPLGDPVQAQVLKLRDPSVAVVELAQASGLLLCDHRDPLRTSTYGTGEMIRAALELEIEELWVALGGSATVDGGAGLAQALGYRLLDQHGHSIAQGGGALLNLAHIEPPAKNLPLPAKICGLCDVHAPLLGPTGAAQVFGPQKGATPEQVVILEQGLALLAQIIQRDLGRDVTGIPGAGAAGGAGAGLVGFLGATLVSGGATVQEAIGLDRQLAQADLLITGEGSLDRQSLMGKGVGALIHKAQALSIPILVVAGQVDPTLEEDLQRQGIASASLVAQAGSVELAMQNPLHWIPKALHSLFADLL